jgi:hypothetical protein
MGKPISDEEFGDLFRTFERSAFRLETRDRYALSYEREEFERFLAGSPTPPSEITWWRSWLDQTAALTAQGKFVGRVRILDEPPSDYQRWMLWAAPWYAEAGEVIRWLPRSTARAAGVGLDRDWWLFDLERLVVMEFTGTGEIAARTLVTDPVHVARYRRWHDLALWNAATAESIVAA